MQTQVNHYIIVKYVNKKNNIQQRKSGAPEG